MTRQSFIVTDNTFDRGRTGLYCWSNNGIRFADLRLMTAECHPAYNLPVHVFVTVVPAGCYSDACDAGMEDSVGRSTASAL